LQFWHPEGPDGLHEIGRHSGQQTHILDSPGGKVSLNQLNSIRLLG
jgi:hypothetical protein